VKQLVYQDAAQRGFMLEQLAIEDRPPQAYETAGPDRFAAGMASIDAPARGPKAPPKAERYALSAKMGKRLLELR
jgi:hypothetical protein